MGIKRQARVMDYGPDSGRDYRFEAIYEPGHTDGINCPWGGGPTLAACLRDLCDRTEPRGAVSPEDLEANVSTPMKETD